MQQHLLPGNACMKVSPTTNLTATVRPCIISLDQNPYFERINFAVFFYSFRKLFILIHRATSGDKEGTFRS